MIKIKVGAVVNYCSVDQKFLLPCLRELRKFCTEIVVVTGDKLFDGTPDRDKWVEMAGDICHAFPSRVTTSFFSVQLDLPIESDVRPGKTWYWSNFSRLRGYMNLQDVDWVLFVDVDEIFEGDLMAQMLDQQDLNASPLNAIVFPVYWYFAHPWLRAKTIEHGPLCMVRNSALDVNLLLHPWERSGLAQLMSGQKALITGSDGPIVHHYSWVRTHDEMLKKVRAWSHHADKDWESLVNDFFLKRPDLDSPEFRDFVHGYEFETVTPYLKF